MSRAALFPGQKKSLKNNKGQTNMLFFPPWRGGMDSIYWPSKSWNLNGTANKKYICLSWPWAPPASKQNRPWYFTYPSVDAPTQEQIYFKESFINAVWAHWPWAPPATHKKKALTFYIPSVDGQDLNKYICYDSFINAVGAHWLWVPPVNKTKEALTFYIPICGRAGPCKKRCALPVWRITFTSRALCGNTHTHTHTHTLTCTPIHTHTGTHRNTNVNAIREKMNAETRKNRSHTRTQIGHWSIDWLIEWLDIECFGMLALRLRWMKCTWADKPHADPDAPSRHIGSPNQLEFIYRPSLGLSGGAHLPFARWRIQHVYMCMDIYI